MIKFHDGWGIVSFKSDALLNHLKFSWVHITDRFEGPEDFSLLVKVINRYYTISF